MGVPEAEIGKGHGIKDSESGLKYSHMQTMRVGLVMCPLWFAANLSYNASLSMTSITSSTIISTTSTLWTFLFAVCTRAERGSALALAGVILTMAGALMSGLHPSATHTFP